MTLVESKAINSVRFVCIIFLVLLHTQISHLVSSDVQNTMTSIQTFLSIPFLPILFLLSGYLFFCEKNTVNQHNWIKNVWIIKLKKRVKTLLIPYVIWCLIAIIYNHYVKHVALPIDFLDFIRQFWNAAGGGHPIGKAMWYIKSLIIFSLFAPLYFFVIKYLKHFTLLILLVLPSFKLAIDFPFFNYYLLLGAYLSIMGFSFGYLINNLNYKLCLFVYIGLKFIRLYVEFPDVYIYIDFILCFVGLFGLFMKYNISSVLVSSSSFIYFFHPYVTGVRNIYVKFVEGINVFQYFSVWMISSITVIVICLVLFMILKRYIPNFIRILTGDRI